MGPAFPVFKYVAQSPFQWEFSDPRIPYNAQVPKCDLVQNMMCTAGRSGKSSEELAGLADLSFTFNSPPPTMTDLPFTSWFCIYT